MMKIEVSDSNVNIRKYCSYYTVLSSFYR